MAAATGIRLVKQFNYRGDPEEEWSNMYWLTGNPPTQVGDWASLFDALIALEVPCYSPGSRVIQAFAWNDDAPHAQSVYTRDYVAEGITHVGTLQATAGTLFAGDQAGMVEWKTARKSTRGKPVYLRKYFHDGYADLVNTDNVSSATAAAYTNFVALLASGSNLGGRIIRSQKGIEQILTSVHSPYVTTRTLKRRGKRP